MGIVSDKNASYKLLAQELKALGYSVSEEHDDKRLYVNYVSPKGRIWRARAAMIDYPFTSATVRSLSKNKSEATKYVAQQGMNTPVTMKLPGDTVDITKVEKFMKRHERVVVKPLNRSLSVGLTTDVKTITQAEKAIHKAGRYSDAVLVQEQVFGDEIRFAVVNGKVISALLRQTPRVVGDGVSTVTQLIRAENKERRAIKNTVVKYPQLTNDLVHSSIEMHRIPGKGEVVELSRATMIAKGCSVYDVLGDLDDSYVKLVETLVEGLDTGFIVADVMIKDFRQPASPDNYWFIEFNTAPVLKLFYSCRDGKMHDILPVLADAVDKHLHASSRPTVGSFESVSLPTFGIQDWIAKIDTGAYSGALHCETIQVVRKNGKKILQFSAGHRKRGLFETDVFYEKHVRSSNGQREKRYLVDTTIVLKGKEYSITIGLTDRSEMKHDVLIGRRFLRDHNMLVDVTVNQEYDTDSEAK